jgi:hypothetical protein
MSSCVVVCCRERELSGEEEEEGRARALSPASRLAPATTSMLPVPKCRACNAHPLVVLIINHIANRRAVTQTCCVPLPAPPDPALLLQICRVVRQSTSRPALTVQLLLVLFPLPSSLFSRLSPPSSCRALRPSNIPLRCSPSFSLYPPPSPQQGRPPLATRPPAATRRGTPFFCVLLPPPPLSRTQLSKSNRSTRDDRPSLDSSLRLQARARRMFAFRGVLLLQLRRQRRARGEADSLYPTPLPAALDL